MRILVVILGLGLAAVGAADEPFQIRVRYQPVANFIYQLECLSGVELRCGEKNFRLLWEKNISSGPAARVGLADWKALHQRLEKSVKYAPEIGLDFGDTFRIASLQARDFEDYFTRLDLLMRARDRSRAAAIIRTYRKPFEEWWAREGALRGQFFAKTTEELLASGPVRQRLRQFAQFYGAQLAPDTNLVFNLMFRPDAVAEPTNGRQIENYSYTEFVPRETPRDRLNVVIHELCHFFYRSAEDGALEQLKRKFQLMIEPGAVPAFNLLNETLATALGNGLINRDLWDKARWEAYLARSHSFYNDEFIDRAAKGILSWLDGYLKQGGRLHAAGFPAAYFKAVKGVLGPDLLAPALYFREMTLLTDFEQAEEVSQLVHGLLRNNGIETSGPHLEDDVNFTYYEANPAVSVMIIVRPASVPALRMRGLLTAAQAQKFAGLPLPQMFAIRRTPASYNLFILASSPPQIRAAVMSLAARKTMVEGVVPIMTPAE